MGTSINITDEATPLLNRIHATLADRVRINRQIAREVVVLCKNYVQRDAPSRHGTAQKLGATPTGFLEHAIGAIHFEVGAELIVIDFSHPWYSRVGHDVHIEPGPGKKFLAIPIASVSYGKRLQGNFTDGKFFRGPNGGLFYGVPYPGNPNVLQPLYVLVRSVDQKQDRSRLPSDEQILASVRTALREQIEDRIASRDFAIARGGL